MFLKRLFFCSDLDIDTNVKSFVAFAVNYEKDFSNDDGKRTGEAMFLDWITSFRFNLSFLNFLSWIYVLLVVGVLKNKDIGYINS